MKKYKENHINILDCTLRDGGYYNSWDFKPPLVKKYLQAIINSSIDYVELGFRFKNDNPVYGPFAYTTDKFLNSLVLPKDKKLGVMINAKDFLEDNNPVAEIKKYFIIKEQSKISFVRIAIELEQLNYVKQIAKALDEMGYEVIINIMQANLASETELQQAAKKINSWGIITVLYFADSLGSMRKNDIENCINTLSKEWKGPIGFHAHNNMHLALSNAMQAIENNCTFCDSTILGMGRGAGNAQTESLLLEVTNHFYDNTIMQVALASFDGLKRKYKWGPNSFYHFAAKHHIHPTYVQRLLSERRYSSEYVVNTLNYLKDIKSSSYNEDNLSKVTYFSDSNHQGKWNASNYLSKENVLLIGSGPTVRKFSKEIELFIKKHSPYVITLNVNSNINKKMVDAVIASNINRILLDLDLYKSLDCKVIMPKSCFSSVLKEKVSDQNILDYGLSIKKNSFKSYSRGCASEWQEVTAYSLLLILQAAPKKIFLAGFDGYSQEDPRYRTLNKIFKLYLGSKNSLELTTLTPSHHKFFQSY